MSTHAEVHQAVEQMWDRAEAHLFMEYGRQPSKIEVALCVFNAQLCSLAVALLPDPDQRLAWVEMATQAMLGGRMPGAS